MRPVESSAYQGSDPGEREIFGPVMETGVRSANRAPMYSKVANPSKISASPRLKAGRVRLNVSPKRRRMVYLHFLD